MANTESVTCQTHPLRAVEAKELRAGRIKADSAGCAGVMRREKPVGPALSGNDDRSVTQLERLFDGLN